MKRSLVTFGVAAVAALLSVGCSTANSSTQASNNTTEQITVKTDSSLATLPDSYFQANATVDKFLNDWLSLDSKDGIALLNSNAKQGKTATQLEQYFAQVPPGHSSYEVVGYKKVSDTEYQFNVWMYGYAPGTYGPKGQPRPSPKMLTVVKRKYKWYINNLPKF